MDREEEMRWDRRLNENGTVMAVQCSALQRSVEECMAWLKDSEQRWEIIAREELEEDESGSSGAECLHQDGDVARGNKLTALMVMAHIGRGLPCFNFLKFVVLACGICVCYLCCVLNC